jgi:hypothetical protein
MNIIFKSLAVLTVFILSVAPVFAAGPGFATVVDDGCPVPLDGGLSFLAAAGIGYGIKKYSQMRNAAKATA